MLVGITSTIPCEIVYAAGDSLCDLNNLFISDENPGHFLERAEQAGFPATSCAWIKGIYGVLQEHSEIDTVIVVSGGDCSNNLALGEVLAHDGRHIIPFTYPASPDIEVMHRALSQLAARFTVSPEAIGKCKQQFDAIRKQLAEIDRLTWQEHRISGRENLEHLVSASDFQGHPLNFATAITRRLNQARKRPPRVPDIRLGLVGVPPILHDLFTVLEELGADSLFNEVPRQFAMPWAAESSLAEQYSHYTYPYPLRFRIQDIITACRQRRLDGIIHYTQSFCFRQIEDIILKRELPIPVLTLEADRPNRVDGRTLTRLETFIEMLRWKKSSK